MDISRERLSRHELRELRREGRKKERKESEDRQVKSKKRGRIITYIVIVLVLAGIGFGAYSLSTGGNGISPEVGDYLRAQLATIPSSFVHWHADADVVICGENRQLPEARVGGLLGTQNIHTHDKATNAGSITNSDGNGVLHNEGNFHEAPYEHTLGKFFQNIGVPFSESGVMNVKNGDACPAGGRGTMKVFINEKEAVGTDFLYYIPLDGDRIRIVFE